MSDTIRVLIADDHVATRAGVRSVLEPHGFEIVAEASDAKAAAEEASRTRPDLCLIDVHMPGSGISAIEKIAPERPETAIVALTVSRNDDDLFDAIRAGASGYLLKDTSAKRLPFALQDVVAGEAAMPRALVARLVDEFRARGRYRRIPVFGSRGPMLTNREWDVLELLGDGLSTKQIAARLFLSPATVRSHVAAILRKLGVADRAAAVHLLREHAA